MCKHFAICFAILLTTLGFALDPIGSELPNGLTSNPANAVLNIEDSPIFLFAQGRSLSIRNLTATPMKSYSLGCARIEKGKVRLIRRFPANLIEIPPRGELSSAGVHLPPDEVLTCQDLQARLIPVQAVPKAGDTWKLSPKSKISIQ